MDDEKRLMKHQAEKELKAKKEQEKKARKEREKKERIEKIIKSEKKILKISFFAGLAFAVAELIFAIYSHSQSSMMDAVYDSTELIFIALILFLTPLFHSPVSEKHPYGFYQVESIFLIIKGFMMISVTFGVSMDVIQTALSGGNVVDGLQVSVFQLLLGICCLVVYIIMNKLNKHLNSPTVDAEILGWKLDISYSLGMSLAFFASVFLEKTPLRPFAPYFDSLMAVLVIVSMLPENVKMLWGAIKDVFLFSHEEDLEEIKTIVSQVLEPYRCEPVFYDVLRTGRHLWVSVYITYGDEYLDMESYKSAYREVKQAVRDKYQDCSCELIIEV